ncbi:hypothetical protein FRC20_001933 [Serendipita sp. 405]|nr:hypothetical protein FRC15_003912 [Serendipita sp. 397]KAG8800949.1 hypothetical protein FRC16_001628 [Serendipita sp. 398]KAG8869214.1 hypothetical protein FRC20_001933 [Serendipita sp. 405]
MVKITGYKIRDVRFPTSLTGDGTDAMNTECDYSSAYITLLTDSDLVGHGMTFTIGRGNDIVCNAISQVADRLVGKETESLFENMGKTWEYLVADPQLRWIGPEKGVIHIATGAVDNALWDIAGWLGYDDEKVKRLTLEALHAGFNHFKMKVGADRDNDLRRGKIIRSVIDDPANLPPNAKPRDPATLVGKNAGPTGNVLMIDANQVWDVPQAIEYVKSLQEIRPWFIEEPTAPDDILGHARIRKELKEYGIGVATGEHAHNRMVFKQLMQANAIDVAQIDSCRLAGVSEVLSVLLMAAKFGVPVTPHAGGVGLCEYVIHLSLIDYIAVSGSIDRNVLEYVDHLHEHFTYPCSINSQGHYNVPSDSKEGYSIEMKESSFAEFEFPHGSYWASVQKK